MLLVLGDQIFAALGVPPPELYNQVKEKKLAMAMAVWFLGNMLHNSLTSTGAFEVFYDGQQVEQRIKRSAASCTTTTTIDILPYAWPLQASAVGADCISQNTTASACILPAVCQADSLAIYIQIYLTLAVPHAGIQQAAKQ